MARNLAIAVGINKYRFLPPLRCAVQDAEVIQNFLLQKAGFEEVFLFTDNSRPVNGKSTEPFRENLRRVMRQISEQPLLGEGDSFWFFFSGHGVVHENRDYLMPINGDPEDVEDSGIPTHDITDFLSGCGAENTVLILDACRNRGRKGGESIGQETGAEAQRSGVISIFSCSRDQYSYEIEALKQGVFTSVLLQGLQHECPPDRSTVEQLNDFLRKQVPQLNRQYNQEPQHPYIIAPAHKVRQIILPSQTHQVTRVDQLKAEAARNENSGDFDQAKQLWRQVIEIAANLEDRKLAVDRIEEIIQMQRHQESPVSSNPDSQATPQPPKAVYPPPVDPKYRQEPIRKSSQPPPKAASPPPVEQRYREEEIYRLSEPSPVQSHSNQPTNRAIPWISLIIGTLIYAIIGFVLAAATAPFWLWAGAGAWTWFVAGVASGSGVTAGGMALAWAWAAAGALVGTLAGGMAWAGAGALVGAGAWAGDWSVVVAGEKLRESFGRFHTFLLLAETSWLGLGLGWVGHWVFQQVSRG